MDNKELEMEIQDLRAEFYDLKSKLESIETTVSDLDREIQSLVNLGGVNTEYISNLQDKVRENYENVLEVKNNVRVLKKLGIFNLRRKKEERDG